MLKPYTPLPQILPNWVIDFLKQNPTNSMAYYEGIDQVTAKPRLDFFIKCEASDAQYVMDSPTIHAALSLEERQVDPYVGHAVFARVNFVEAEFHRVGEGIDVAVTDRPPAQFAVESEFPVQHPVCMFQLRILITQPTWQFIFVDNDCRWFFNAKRFRNPLSLAERDRWLKKIPGWTGRSP